MDKAVDPSTAICYNDPYSICLNLLLKGSLIRSLSLRSYPSQMTSMSIEPIEDGRVHSDSVIPYNDGSRSPLDSGLEVLSERDVVIQELEQVV